MLNKIKIAKNINSKIIFFLKKTIIIKDHEFLKFMVYLFELKLNPPLKENP